MERYLSLGIMSGTSLDGLDLALCEFRYERSMKHTSDDKTEGSWSFQILEARTVPYPRELALELRKAQKGSALNLIALHKRYGKFIAEKVNEFLVGKSRPMLIASHGHTVFHYPDAGINFQIGDGAIIVSLTGLPVVCDFRSQDIALGGQGAPLVPAGDYFLFPGYNILLNLGGFSNVTIRNRMIAFDISPVNYALNYFARQFGLEFDRDGQLGRKGKVYPPLLDQLNNLDYYSMEPPKSLSDHWFYNEFLQVLEAHKIDIMDKFATVYHHIAWQIASVVNQEKGRVLVTGGGAKNKYLIELIRSQVKNEVIIPDPLLVDFKEAMVFAFLGLLRWLGKENVFSSFTGAGRNSISGAVYLP